ncbi:sodium:dicarboxylate symporter [Prosthecochloris sp. GSB1]|uniref:dicarboxylate/amino acid:cation symporter n=1 Tax=Prosthecochloris sp. GSB1 TaxID=281093 RepID=UPI000B8CA4F7|nr:dicarboxylate/amino acid:cation symporter [Prosthecochloris sp. GSB1]ASQ90596.1 sodium:dicarboxylate symporter [Prosthecochloris sp. GSB1]
MKNNGLLAGIVAGIAAGSLLGGFAPEAGTAVSFIGHLFIRFLMMLVVPLVVAAMVSGVCKLGDVRKLGPLGLRTVFYYLSTTALSVITGIVLVLTIHPGKLSSPEEQVSARGGLTLPDVTYRIEGNRLYLENHRLPKEFSASHTICLNDQQAVGRIVSHLRSRTEHFEVSGWRQKNGKAATVSPQGKGITIDRPLDERFSGEERSIVDILREVLEGLVPSNLFRAMAENDILPIITFSLLLGAVLSTLGEQGRPVIDFFQSLNEAIMKLVHLVMYVAPVGIGALIAGRLGDAGGFAGFLPELLKLGSYTLTVIAGLLIHALVTLPLLLKLFGKTGVAGFAKNTSPALLTAFSTASSAATLPLTVECAEEKNGVSPRTAGFVLPLGATINMDGTALYEAVAVIFIAQINGITLGIPELSIVFLTATLAAVGAAGIPEAGLVTMVLVLKAVGLPVEGIALILAVDWFLDRCRTTVNVWGDSVGARIIDRYANNMNDGAR